MLEISELKEKKLPELQEIAKGLKIPRFSSLKKLDLIYQILDVQAAKPSDNQKEASAKAEIRKQNIPQSLRKILKRKTKLLRRKKTIEITKPRS